MKAHEQIMASLSFFTRLPGLKAYPFNDQSPFTQIVWTFPIIGALIGIMSGTIYWLWHAIGLSPSLSAILAITSQIVITGGLHEDGLADTIDGFFGGRDKPSRLHIMRDSRIGSFGALALLFSFFMRTAALGQLASPHAVMISCIAAAALSRAAIAISMFVLPHARTDGLAAWAGKPTLSQVLESLALAGIVTIALMGTAGIAMCVAALAACAGVCLFSRAKINGITGDVYGTIQQIIEIIIFTIATVTLQA